LFGDDLKNRPTSFFFRVFRVFRGSLNKEKFMQKRLSQTVCYPLSVIFLIFLLYFPHTAHSKSDDDDASLYIIQLTDPPLSKYQGGISGLSPTSLRNSGKSRLDIRSSESKAYREYLSNKREQVKSSMEDVLGHIPDTVYIYDVVYNGMAIRLTPEEAEKISALPDIVSVQKDEPLCLMTDVSPEFINATDIWDGTGSGGLPGTKGEGMIIGIIDTGVWPEHPSFADDGTYPSPPLKWGGKCTPPADNTDGYQCNNKLIGIQYFLDGYIAWNEGVYDGLFYSGRDGSGHGTHTASTAGGNENVPASIYGIDRGTVSGIAPRAQIASYKTGMMSSDSVAAINKAVADGVDVINYSIGSALGASPWSNAEAAAFLGAREAGVFVAVSAGNSGPESGSVSSPANAPWVTAAGASYSNRLFLSEIEIRSDSGIQNYYGATPTRGIENFTLRDTEGIADIEGDTSGECLHPFPTGTFKSTDAVLCERSSGASTASKGNFVQDGGAGAVVFYNGKESYDLNSYLYPIPAVFVSREIGLAMKDMVAECGAQGTGDRAQVIKTLDKKESETPATCDLRPVSISFSQGEPVYAPDSRIPTDMVAGFSSRGPATMLNISSDLNEISMTPFDILKPDLTAPGVHILAGASPDYAETVNGQNVRLGQQNELFQVIQGTSMSSPHIAGLGALLKSLRPEWTPAQIQSALMSTAITQNLTARNEDGDIPATPFDAGAGRADVSRAAQAGILLDETEANYKSANPANGGEPSALNIASLTNANCLGECAWSRTLQSSADVPVTWSVLLTGEAAKYLTANPVKFTLDPGTKQEISVRADVSSLVDSEWIFAQLSLIPDLPLSFPNQHLPVAIRPVAGVSPVKSVSIETRRSQGGYNIEGFKAVETHSLSPHIYISEPEFTEETATGDSSNEAVYDDVTDGTFIRMLDIPPSVRRIIVEITESTANDLDLYIGIDENGNGIPESEEELITGTKGSWIETCELPRIGNSLESGTYWIMIQNWSGDEKVPDEFTLALTLIDSEGGTGGRDITASGPKHVIFNEPFDIQVSWNVPEMEIGTSLEGWIDLGTDPAHPANIMGVPLTFSRIGDDVSLTADPISDLYPGDTVTYTINILAEKNNPSELPLIYSLTCTIPEGMRYVPDSATVDPDAVIGNQILWSADAEKTSRIKISYQAVIDEDLISPGDTVASLLTLVNTLEHAIPGVSPAIASCPVRVSEYPFLKVGSGRISQKIPDGKSRGLVSAIRISKNAAITDVNVVLNIRHPYIEDLRAYLVSPSGSTVTLFENLTGLRENFAGTVLDNDAEIRIENGNAPFTGSFRPQGDLGLFNQESPEGEWELRIYDDKFWDEGTLLSWELEIAYESAKPAAGNDTARTGADEPILIDVLANDRDPDGESLRIVSVTDPSHGSVTHDGKTVTYTPDPGFTGEDSFTYQVSDDNDGASAAEVAVTVEKAGISMMVTTVSDVVRKDKWLSLREAVMAANTNQAVDDFPGGGFRDTILLPPGIIRLGMGGSLEITSHLNIIGDSRTGTLIESNGTDRIFSIAQGAEVRIENITLQRPSPDASQSNPPQFPWMAALVYRGFDAYSGQFCNGTLVHPEWVLTSAQCLENVRRTEVDAVFPSASDSSLFPSYGLGTDDSERIEADWFVIHPDYDPETLDSDLALVHLSQASERSCANLISAKESSEADFSEASVSFMEWGSDGKLSRISMPLVSNEIAEILYGLALTENMLATGYGENSAGPCRGDKGGPLMITPDQVSDFFETSDFFIQAGIISQGGCDAGYGIYTRISQFANWINEQTGGAPLPSGLWGGAILNQGNLIISSSTLTRNSAVLGGAVYNSGDLSLINSTVSGNSAMMGGGVYNDRKLETVFSTVSANWASEGGGIFNASQFSGFNSIIADNTAYLEGPDLTGRFSSQGGNIIGKSLGISGDFQDNDLPDTDPLLCPLTDNGGTTMTHAIQAKGPAYNAVTCIEEYITDQRGMPRGIRDCDIGAFEYEGSDYPPAAVNDTASTSESIPIAIDVLANDRDANGDELTIIAISFPENGTVKEKKNGKIRYAPNKDFVGTDSFTYLITDGKEEREAIVTVNVGPNMLPLIRDDEAAAFSGKAVAIDVLANDRDPEGEPLTVLEVSKPEHGEAMTDGLIVTYTPAEDFIGTEQFMYRATDDFKIGKAYITATVEAPPVEPDPEIPPQIYHSADYDPRDHRISRSELNRVLSFFNKGGGYACGEPDVEDGYILQEAGAQAGQFTDCNPHDSDYNPQDWQISLNELLRLIELYNASGYYADEKGEDGFAANSE
jgi:uncharacterized repeat protein (TIGR01451 family)